MTYQEPRLYKYCKNRKRNNKSTSNTMKIITISQQCLKFLHIINSKE